MFSIGNMRVYKEFSFPLVFNVLFALFVLELECNIVFMFEIDIVVILGNAAFLNSNGSEHVVVQCGVFVEVELKHVMQQF